MQLDPMEWLQRDLITAGQLEPQTVDLYDSLLKAGDVYIDVGCHIGFHTLIARKLVRECGRVVAFDPQPYNAENVLVNWRLNGFDNISVYVAAVGNSTGYVTLNEPPCTDRSRLSLLSKEMCSTATFTVPIVRLDEVFERENIERVTLLKIDTEGFELDVLLGLGSALNKVDNVILEILPSQKQCDAKRTRKLLSILRDSGFALNTVVKQPWLELQPLPENNLWATRAVFS